MKIDTELNEVTFIVIGKNEGKNLDRCFKSLKYYDAKIIYVDSGSLDNSIQIAKENNLYKIVKVECDNGTPALSRSVGANLVDTKYIHFVDGDMTIDKEWLKNAITFINTSKDICGVHGFKKVFTRNVKDYFILKDKESWLPDYLQGAFLIKTQIFRDVGGFDTRMYGEEERDLYVRLLSNNTKIWYVDYLMGEHYDLKTKSFSRKYFSECNANIWLPIFKSIKNNNFRKLIFVYRTLLPVLIMELISFYYLIFNIQYSIFIQILIFLYSKYIKRPGFCIIWKVALLNAPRLFKIINKRQEFNVINIK